MSTKRAGDVQLGDDIWLDGGWRHGPVKHIARHDHAWGAAGDWIFLTVDAPGASVNPAATGQNVRIVKAHEQIELYEEQP